MDKTKKGSRVAPERPNTVKDIDKAGRSDNYGEKGAKTDEGTCRIEKEQTDVEYHHQADQRVDLKDETEHEKSKRKKKTRRKSSDVLLAQDELPQSHSQEIQRLDETEHERSKRKKKKRRKSIDVLSAQDELSQSHSEEIQRLDETEHEKSKRKKKKRRKSIDLLSAQDELPQSHSQEIQGLDIEQSERTDSHHVARVAKNCILIPDSKVVMHSNKVIRKDSDWTLLVADHKMDLTNNKFEIVSAEKEQEQPTGKQKKTTWKTKSRQETFEEQAEPDKSSQAQGQAINGNDIEQTGITDIQYVAQVARKCTYIPETGIVMYSNEADDMLDWAYLVSGREMDKKKIKRFEIKVVNTGHRGIIALGLVPADYNTDAAPGWLKDSVAYHTVDGGLFIESTFALTKITTAKRGDKIALEISSYKDKEIYQFQVNDSHIKLQNLKTGLYPCLAMRSRGAAVKLLDETFVNNGGDAEIPTMSSMKKDGIQISPNKTLPLWERKGALYGLMSISNVNPARQHIAFQVLYGESEERVLVRDVLAYKHTWAECLQVQKVDRNELPEEIRVQWIQMQKSEAEKYLRKRTLTQIFKEKKESLKTHRLEVEIGKSDEQSDLQSEEAEDEQSEGDQLFERICSTKDDDEIEDLIDAYTGGMNNPSQTHSGILKKVSEFDYSTQGLLQFLATNINTLEDDGKLPNENILIENVQKILKHLDEATILQASEKEDKLTLLHYAALCGSTKLIDLLLKKNKRIQYLAYKRSPSGIPLEIAIQRKHDETAKTLVNLMTRKSVVSLFWNRESQIKSPTIKQLLKSNLTHTTSAVLDQFIEKDGWLLGPLELDDYNQHPTDSNYEQKHKTAYQMLANSNIKLETLQAFANHECVKELTNNKWNNYASKLFWIPCCLFFVAWVALTTAAVMGVMAEAVTTYDKPLDDVRGGCEAFAYIYSFVTFLGEILQFKLQGRMYWCNGCNYLDIFSSLLILIVLPLRMTHQNAQWGIFAVGYILGTLRVIKFMTMSRRLGQLGFIIQRLVFDVLKFGLYFLVILLSFSGGLLLALKGDDSLNVHDDTSTFWGILFVGVRVLVETQPIDDIEYTGPNGYRALSCAIMMIFLALTCVVMLNIFIAQLSSRFNNEHERVDLKFETHRAITIAKYELGEDLMSYIRLFCRNPYWVKYVKLRTSADNNDTLSHTDVDGGCLSATMRCFRSCCYKCFRWTVVIFLLLICPCFVVYLYCSEDEDEDEDEN